MARKQVESPKSIEQSQKADDELALECEQHEKDSYSNFSTLRADWPDKEAMLLASRPVDKLSQKTKSKIQNPALSTMVIERSSRVMSQPPQGRAFAVSKDDVVKNMVMNMMLKHYQKTANEEGSHLLKLRHLNVYSHVYGSSFGLVPWRVNRINDYIGPELLPISMRDIRPQPGRRTIDKMDWFGVRSKVTLAWLKKQDNKVWRNVDKLEADMKERKDPGESGKSNTNDTQSFIEQQRYPTKLGDAAFPDVEIFTFYYQDKWVTYVPKIPEVDGSRPYILRVVENPYVKGYLPIVVKHAFPLMDSIVGLGDFERGKSLQFAMNSLINLYMDGVKYAIFPPLHINLDNVDPMSIMWGAGNKWYMKNPNADVQPMNMNTTQWIDTFQSTYGFFSAAIQNLSGSTQSAQPEGVSLGLGKTPEAIKKYGMNETARDEWDRFMMEDTCNQIYMRWIALTAKKLEVPITMRIFGAELKDLKKDLGDSKELEVFGSGTRGNIKVSKKLLNDGDEDTQYDYEIDSGSTVQKTNVDEGEASAEMIKDFKEVPWLIDEIRKRGKDINFAELYKRRMISGGTKDWDRILVDLEVTPTNEDGKVVDPNAPPVDPAAQALATIAGGGVPAGGPPMPGVQPPMPAGVPGQMPLPVVDPGVQGPPMPVDPNAPPVPQDSNGFKDPQLAELAAQLVGGGA